MSGAVLGAVLAGGVSSRFGSDKALAVLRGRTLLDHADATLARFVGEVVVVGRGAVADRPAAGLGPLGGIAGALDEGRRRGFDSVLTVACDTVSLPDALLDALLDRAPAYCLDAPVLGHWPTTLAGDLARHLATALATASPPVRDGGHRADPAVDASSSIGGRARGRQTRVPALSVRRWAEAIGARPIRSPMPLANVNTPADLAAL